MTDVQRLLSDFIAADKAGDTPDPLEYLGRVRGVDRAELEALLDAYLARAPRRPIDEAAFEASRARVVRDELVATLTGASGTWPTLLPQLRHRAQVTRAQLVKRLASELDAEDEEAKVGAYYHAMEQGQLAPAGVSDRVLEALSRIVGESVQALRRAGKALAAGGAPGTPEAVFARVAVPDEQYADEAQSAADRVAKRDERDFVDELFTGGSDAGT